MCPDADRPDPHSPSAERVLAATGRDWRAWFDLLDDANAVVKDHKGIVALVPSEVAWRHLFEGEGRTAWLGQVDDFEPIPGASYRCDDGTTDDVRSVRPGQRLRLLWHPSGWTQPSTLQLTVQAKDERCIVAIHHEHLPDESTRQVMKERWTAFLKALRDGFEVAPGDRVG